MRIWKLIEKTDIFLNLTVPDKDAVIRYIATVCKDHGIVNDDDKLYQGLLQREDTMSTGIGQGIAIPHTSNPEAKRPALFVIHLAQPIDFSAIDGKPVDIVLSIVVPEDQMDLHLQILARLSRLCSRPAFLDAIRNAENQASLHETIKEMEEATANY